MSQHVNPKIVWLDEGGAALGAEVILGHLDADMSVEDVRVELTLKRGSVIWSNIRYVRGVSIPGN